MLLRSTAASISRSASGFVRSAAAVRSLRTRPSSRQVPPAFACAGRTCVRFCLIGSHRGLLSYSRVSCSALRPLRGSYYGLG